MFFRIFRTTHSAKTWLVLIVLINSAVVLPGCTQTSVQEQSLAEATELNEQAWELYQQGKYDEAVPLLEESLAIRKQVLGAEHPDVATSFNNGVRFFLSLIIRT